MIEIVRNKFKSGVNIYEDKDIEKIKEIMKNQYGKEYDSTNRALGSYIQQRGVLINKGKYIIADGYLLSDELAEKIYTYIFSDYLPL